jgi:hypothetical protein
VALTRARTLAAELRRELLTACVLAREMWRLRICGSDPGSNSGGRIEKIATDCLRFSKGNVEVKNSWL